MRAPSFSFASFSLAVWSAGDEKTESGSETLINEPIEALGFHFDATRRRKETKIVEVKLRVCL